MPRRRVEHVPWDSLLRGCSAQGASSLEQEGVSSGCKPRADDDHLGALRYALLYAIPPRVSDCCLYCIEYVDMGMDAISGVNTTEYVTSVDLPPLKSYRLYHGGELVKEWDDAAGAARGWHVVKTGAAGAKLL
jgi:hypothetical protein